MNCKEAGKCFGKSKQLGAHMCVSRRRHRSAFGLITPCPTTRRPVLTALLCMASADIEWASSIPLPVSPPPDTPSFSSELGPVPRDPVNENYARSADGERDDVHHDTEKHTVASPIPTPNPEREQLELATSQDVLASQHEPDAPSGDVEAHQESSSAVQERPSSVSVAASPPPTPPTKPAVNSPPVSPPVRRDSFPPASSINGNGRASTESTSSRIADARRKSRNVPAPVDTQPRSSSPASHRRSLTISKGHTVSVVLISSALETIAASREAKRSAPLRESVQRALDMVRSGQGGDRPREIFEPLRLACETRSEKLMIASLDCISKLISYSFFVEADSASQQLPSPPVSPHPRHSMSNGSHTNLPTPTLVDLVVNTITACHTETTPEAVSLQIVKALLALVLSPTILVHQSSLLKAVRTVYNVFLLSMDPVNQMVAQGGLTQMVNHVFARCRPTSPRSSYSDSSATLASKDDRPAYSKRPSLTPSLGSSQLPSIPSSSRADVTVVEEPEAISSTSGDDHAVEINGAASYDAHDSSNAQPPANGRPSAEDQPNGHAGAGAHHLS